MDIFFFKKNIFLKFSNSLGSWQERKWNSKIAQSNELITRVGCEKFREVPWEDELEKGNVEKLEQAEKR